jgi:hypothetical protein
VSIIGIKLMPQADLPANQPLRSSGIESDPGELQSNITLPENVTDNSDDLKDIAVETLTNALLGFPEKSEEDWETVNFPNAISVDAIPTASRSGENCDRENPELLATVKPTDSSSTQLPFSVSDRLKTIHFSAEALGKTNAPATLVQALHECNRDLLQRIAELEATLAESQKALQIKEVLLEQHNAELSGAQEQVTRLFGKQEQVNEIIQRQEVLIETLTDQLQTSQTRLAVIERECALTQERYSTQQNLLIRTENSCRELRSRLHRQQRHTLQFKAALERYLEMPHFKAEAKNQVSENSDRDPNSEAESLIDTVAIPKVQSAEVQLIPQNSPVKTWSAAAEQILPISVPVSEEIKTNFLPDQLVINISEETSSNSLAEVETYWHIEQPVTENPFLSAELEEAEIAKVNEWEGVEDPSFSNLIERSNYQDSQDNSNFSNKSDWVASITYSHSATKKRRSLAEIELPSFR